MNAGITEDQRLMVRTMLQGNMSFNRVAEELLAQHPRIHVRLEQLHIDLEDLPPRVHHVEAVLNLYNHLQVTCWTCSLEL